MPPKQTKYVVDGPPAPPDRGADFTSRYDVGPSGPPPAGPTSGGGGGGTVTAVTASPPLASSGGTAPNITHLASGVAAALYGDSTHVGQFTVDADGHVTLAGNVAIAGLAANAITALTGDGTATGPGSVPLTLATVNANVGTFGDSTHVGQFTVNAKGLTTAASSVAISASAIGAVTSITSTAGTITPTGTTTVNVEVTGLPPGDMTNNLGSAAKRWLNVFLDPTGGIEWQTAGGGNLAYYTDGTGPYWYDRTKDSTLAFSLQSFTPAHHTTVATWQNSNGTVAWLTDIPTSLPPSGAAGGDLSGTYPNPTVAKINTVALGTTTATAGNFLIANGTNWATGTIDGLTAKTTPVAADEFLLADSAASFAHKKVTLTNLATATGGITSLTTDVVATGPGAAAATIQSNVVTNAKLAQMAAHTVKSNTTGSTANAADNSLNSILVADGILTTKGDLATFSTTAVRLPVATTDGYVIVADSTQTTGLKWVPLGAVTSGWANVMDLDFSAQGSQTLSSDTTYTIGGLVWTKVNSTNDSTAMAVTNGSGLVITPKSTGSWSSNTRTSPAIELPLSSIITNYDTSMGVRVYFEIASENAAANSDNIVIGIDNLDGTAARIWQVLAYRGFQSAATNVSIYNQLSTGIGNNVAGITLAAGNRTMLLEVVSLGSTKSLGSAAGGGAWPAPATFIPSVYSAVATATINSTTNPISFANMNLVISGQRAGSATAYIVTVKRIRVDIRK